MKEQQLQVDTWVALRNGIDILGAQNSEPIMVQHYGIFQSHISKMDYVVFRRTIYGSKLTAFTCIKLSSTVLTFPSFIAMDLCIRREHL